MNPVKTPLSYLLIIQPSGLPVYAQSFGFESDEACKSFNKIIKKETSEQEAYVMGGYFTALKIFGSEMIKDRLNLLELGFDKYSIKGIIKNEINFIGIFQYFPENMNTEDYYLNFLNQVSNLFLNKYTKEKILTEFVNQDQFKDFTDTLIELSEGGLMAINCRNCLTKCTTENKKCLPHNLYFDRVEFRNGLIKLKDNQDD